LGVCFRVYGVPAWAITCGSAAARGWLVEGEIRGKGGIGGKGG
jgi:hypothetical protein